jgi:hypothetical protein
MRAAPGIRTRFLDRRPILPAPLALSTWCRAWWAGGADHRHDVLGAVDPERLDPIYARPGHPSQLETFWIARNRAEFLQADARDLQATAVAVAPSTERLAEMVDQRRVLEGEIERLRIDSDMLRNRERPRADALERGPAEQQASDAAVLARRVREHGAPVRAVEARVDALRARVREIEIEIARLAATLDVAFEIQVVRSRMLREFYERCAETYRRRLSHGSPGGPAFQAAAMATLTIQRPAWNDGPNPWLPAGLRGDTTTEVTK